MAVDRFDVVVVGAGPAGAAAAIAACRAGASVLLLDQATFPRDKTCGDGIATAAVEVLESLGVTGVTDGYPAIGRLRLVSPGGSTVARPLPRPAYTVPRKVFDDRLVRAAVAAGAELRRHTVRAFRDERAGPVVVDGRFEAAVLIGADGAGSVVRRTLGFPGNPAGHLALAIRGYAPAPNLTEQVIVTTERQWPAYAWSFPIGNGTANIGYGEVLRREPLSRAYLLERLHDLLPVGEPTGLRAHHLPLSTRRPPPGRGRTLLAGDALSLINPFTGEGIFYAVLSGALAGTAAARGPQSVTERYRAALRQRLGRHLRHSSVAARLTRRPRAVDAAMTAAARDGRVFNRLVGLGLEDGIMDARTVTRIAAKLFLPAGTDIRQQ
ncbi:geranylgeranyl reductase family protein [Paractinoplanes ferrugineus]|uniref:NAD(P)/FAD-dependent oxidoreductase n=1 Tax=Paractinoplanes ferrugineus TaxID=113564 RepID=UPI001941CA96|nr:geranylgeranyl reductase family protein [Actinoplanes ferrugineus]